MFSDTPAVFLPPCSQPEITPEQLAAGKACSSAQALAIHGNPAQQADFEEAVRKQGGGGGGVRRSSWGRGRVRGDAAVAEAETAVAEAETAADEEAADTLVSMSETEDMDVFQGMCAWDFTRSRLRAEMERVLREEAGPPRLQGEWVWTFLSYEKITHKVVYAFMLVYVSAVDEQDVDTTALLYDMSKSTDWQSFSMQSLWNQVHDHYFQVEETSYCPYYSTMIAVLKQVCTGHHIAAL